MPGGRGQCACERSNQALSRRNDSALLAKDYQRCAAFHGLGRPVDGLAASSVRGKSGHVRVGRSEAGSADRRAETHGGHLSAVVAASRRFTARDGPMTAGGRGPDRAAAAAAAWARLVFYRQVVPAWNLPPFHLVS